MEYKNSKERDFYKNIAETALKPKNFLRVNINLKNTDVADKLKIGEEVKIVKIEYTVLVARKDGTVLGQYNLHGINDILDLEKKGKITLRSKISGIEMKTYIRIDTKVEFADKAYNIEGIENIELRLKKGEEI